MVARYSCFWVGSLLLALVAGARSSEPDLELYVQQVNVGGATVAYTMTGVGSAMWDETSYLTSNYDLWNPDSVELAGSYTLMSLGWNFESPGGFGPNLGSGLYRFTNSYDANVFFC